MTARRSRAAAEPADIEPAIRHGDGAFGHDPEPRAGLSVVAGSQLRARRLENAGEQVNGAITTRPSTRELQQDGTAA